MLEYSVLRLQSKRLKREVRIFVSLPKSYYKTDKFYPVLYMSDGQNLFDNKQASYGKSWGILETYENYPDLPELIIVGIDSGESRNDELTPFTFEYEGNVMGGKINDYLDFIVNTLKPKIDKKYRAFKSPKNTGIMGSSFGGVLATYAALKYGDHFTRFGCVSNAYFPFQDQMIDLARKSDVSKVKKMYLDVGTKEATEEEYRKTYIESNIEMNNVLKEKIDNDKLRFEIIEEAIHKESAWGIRFPGIIKFLYNG